MSPKERFRHQDIWVLGISNLVAIVLLTICLLNSFYERADHRRLDQGLETVANEIRKRFLYDIDTSLNESYRMPSHEDFTLAAALKKSWTVLPLTQIKCACATTDRYHHFDRYSGIEKEMPINLLS